MTEKGYKDGLVSYVKNTPSGKTYTISTAQEIGKTYWSSVIIHLRFKLFPDWKNRMCIIRNNKEDAHKVHEALKQIVKDAPKNKWIELMPEPRPPEGYNAEAQEILGKYGL